MSTDPIHRVGPAYPRLSEAAPALIIAAGAAGGMAVALAVLLADNRLVVALAVILAGLVIALWRPFAAVLLYFAATAIRPEELGIAPIFLHVERVFAVICALALVMPQVARHVWQPWRWELSDWSVVALLAAACWAVPASVSRPWALRGVYEVAKLGFLYGVIRYSATTAPRLRAIVWVMLLVTAFAALMSLRGEAQGKVYIGEHGVMRAQGPTSTTGDPNALAGSLVSVLPFALLLFGPERRAFIKLLYPALACLLLYVVALTGARGAMVTLGAVILAVILQSRRRLLSLSVAALAVAVLWAVTPQDLRERYATLRTYREEATYQGRVNNLRLGLQMLRDRPLTGCGVTCFMIARFEEYDHRWSDAHNLLAQVAGETGLPGLFAFGFFLAATFVCAWRARKTLGQLGPSAGADCVWLERVSMAAIIMLVAMLVQGLGAHNFLRWQFYVGSALIANSLAFARDALRAPAGSSLAVQPPSP